MMFFDKVSNLILFIVISLITHSKASKDEFCYKKEDCENDLQLFATNELNGMKYLLYDVSREKSYSARRKIYINMARTIQNLGTNWTMVLPPWGLYVPNWKNSESSKNRITWSDFFKIEILQELIPVIEFNEFLEHVSNELDLVLILNRFLNNPFDQNESINFVQSNRYELKDEDCKHIQFYRKNDDEHNIYGIFYGYKDYIKAKKMVCMNVDGDIRIIEDVLKKEFKHSQTVFLQNVDLIKHSEQEDKTYSLFRRSIQLTDRIITRANKFRRKYFDSIDEKDKTFIGSDWKLEKLNRQRQSEIAVGGQYIAVHWLINQYPNGRIDDRINDELNEINQLKLNQIIKQILIALKITNTTLAFIATDGDDELWLKLNDEFEGQLKLEFKSLENFKLFRYKNKSNKLPPLELELIEQWICSHARFFIGTSNSMYTRLVQEEREILRFDSSSTFNVFCDQQADSFCTNDKQNKINF